MQYLSRRTLLSLGTAAAIGAGGYFALTPDHVATDSSITLTPPEALAAAAAGDILLVDIRRPDEWRRTGVAEHAVLIDMRTDNFAAQIKTARRSQTQPVAVICARGVRSARVTQALIDAGLEPILDIPEGMLGSSDGPGWLKRDLPTIDFN